MKKIVITAESGSDMTVEQAREYGVFIVPMHVTMGEKSYEDGSFPPEEICEYYKKTGILPKTSGSTQMDFARIFDQIHEQYPEAQILHLAYSAVTTVSFSCARLEAMKRDYVTILDTKQVSAGQLAVVQRTAEILKENPDITVNELVRHAIYLSNHTKMSFIPSNLEYLKAGGRCSNAAYLGGQLLQLHPCIEICDGKLIAAKKYRGSMEKIIPRFIRESTEKGKMKKDKVWLLWSAGLSDTAKELAEKCVAECGYQAYEWVKTGCVITTHGGPGCFGIVAFDTEEAGMETMNNEVFA